MNSIIQKISDFIFPPRKGALALRGLDYESFLEKAPPSPDCDWANTIFDYRDDFVRSIMWELKYYAHPKAFRFFGQALYEVIFEEFSDEALFENTEKVLLAPIPASRERRKKYKFNPPALLARELKKLDDNGLFEVADPLYRVREVPRQTDIKNKKERIANAKGVFGVKRDKKVEGKTVFVIDDVTTTGATLKDVRRALKEAGAKSVKLFAIGH